MTNVTYNIPLSNTTNESQKDAGNPGLVCSDMFPTTDVYFQDLTANFGEAIVIGICCLLTVISWIIYYAQLRSRYYKFKDVSKRFKTLTLLGLYPMTSLMSSFSLLVPRSTILVDLVTSWFDKLFPCQQRLLLSADNLCKQFGLSYLSVCIYIFITLIFHYFGGKHSMIEKMAPHKVSIRTPPCCCCCCCFPLVKVNAKNVRKFEILTMQIAVVVPFVLFVKAVLWTDDQRVLDGVNPKSTLFYIILATVVSTLFAMYGLVVMVKATEEILKKHRIRMKFLVLQLVLICTNLQSAILAIFNRFDLPPCRGAIGSKVRGSMIQHMIVVFEMFLLQVWASQAYKKAESRDLTDTLIRHGSHSKTRGTVATSTHDLHKYGPEDTKEVAVLTHPVKGSKATGDA